ncbi:PAS domain S-box protein, partial [Zavarzinia sp.]|uniref:PAS domain S-box protein n=1 Tax=Zavarzinia sp. TaxID=2027920 RepID=UPI003562CBE4
MTDRALWRRAVPVALVLLVGLGLAGLAARRQETANHDRMVEDFTNLTSRIANQISSRLWRYQYGLRGARGTIIGAGYEGITRTRFRIYHESRDIDVEFPGARGFGFIRRVPIAQETDFVAAARADGAPDFTVRGLGPNDGDRYVIQFVEPVERNGPAVGLDIASEANRRQAAQRAMRTGEATITAPITLVQAAAKPTQSFLLLLPIYHYGFPRSTPAEREVALFGWVYAALVMSEILHDIDTSGDRVSLALFDATDNGGEYPFYAANALHGLIEDGAEGLLHEDVTLPIYGRQWRLNVQATPAFVERLHQTTPQDVFLAGGVAAVLIAALFYAYRDNLERRRDGLARQALLANIVENANDAIVAEDVSGVITSWNRAAERIFGYPATEAVGRLSAEILWHGPRSGDFESLRDRALDGLATAAFDTAGLRRDGQEVEVAVTAAPITDPGGEVIGIGSTIRDITDRRAAERALKAFNATLERQVAERTSQLETARRDLQTILDTVPSMIGYWDHNLVNRVANKAYCDWFGVAPSQMPGRALRDLLGPAYEGIRAPVEGALRGEPQAFERTIARPDGSSGGRLLAYYLPDVMAGEVRGFYVLLHDVTELTEGRQKLAVALRDNQALLNTIKLHALYSETDTTGCIIDVNEGLCRITGYSRDELIGRNITLLSSGVHDPIFIRSLRDTIESGEVWRGDLCNRAKDGSLHWFDTIIVPFSDAAGRITKFISLRTDITARLAADQALLEAKHSAEAANAAKSAFLANMSHEIRTPLNAVIGLGHLLEQTALDTRQQDYVRKSLSASRALLGLVNDILDLAKIEAGEMTVEAIPYDLEALLTELKDVIGPQAEAKHLSLELETEAPLPPLVIGDPTRVRQILFNLLSNAVKFTDRGGVRIGTRVIGADADEAIEFRIQDTGIGIAPDVLPRLFTPFEQADSSTTRRFGGTGLGLSIVRHLVDLLQGRVAVESEEGVGSVFTVTLPLQLPDSDQAKPVPANETP